MYINIKQYKLYVTLCLVAMKTKVDSKEKGVKLESHIIFPKLIDSE